MEKNALANTKETVPTLGSTLVPKTEKEEVANKDILKCLIVSYCPLSIKFRRALPAKLLPERGQ